MKIAVVLLACLLICLTPVVSFALSDSANTEADSYCKNQVQPGQDYYDECISSYEKAMIFWNSEEPHKLSPDFYISLVNAYKLDTEKTEKKLNAFTSKDLNSIYLLHEANSGYAEMILPFAWEIAFHATIEDLSGKRKYVKQEDGQLGIYLGGEKVRDYEFYPKGRKSKSIQTDSSTIWENIDPSQVNQGLDVRIFYVKNGTVGKIVKLKKAVQ